MKATGAASLQYYGAAGTVTGSMHLVRAGDRRVLRARQGWTVDIAADGETVEL